MAYIYDLADVWASAGTTFNGIKLNVTNTASAGGSMLIDLQIGGVSQFNVRKDGYTNAVGGFTFGGASGNVNVALATAGGVSGISLASTLGIGWTSGAQAFGTSDLFLTRDAANTLAQRNGVNAQAFNLYQSYTDASNYTRGKVSAASGIVTVAGESAGTGATDIDIALTPKGTGRVRYGTHAAIAAETVTGYIEIKDAGGTVRKIAVVS